MPFFCISFHAFFASQAAFSRKKAFLCSSFSQKTSPISLSSACHISSGVPKKSRSICFSFLPKLRILQSQNHFSLRFSSSVFSSFSCIPSVSPPDLPLFKNAVTDRLIQMFFGNLYFLLHIRNSTGYLQNLMTCSCRKIHFLISIP